MGANNHRTVAGLVLLSLLATMAPPARAAELTPKAAAGFDAYARETEARMAAQAKGESFLWLDTLPEKRRREIEARLKRGEVVYQELETRKGGKSIGIPDGIAHHWLGAVFIPDGKLERALAVVQDFDRQATVYAPYIRRSKLVSHKGDDAKVTQQIYNSVRTKAAFNAEFEVHTARPSPARAEVRCRSTRIAELTNADQPDSAEKPVGNDRGYLWRYNTYWRLEEKDGGVYVELESLALSRSIPAVFRWLVNPTIKKIRRDSAQRVLNATRAAAGRNTATSGWQATVYLEV